MSYSAEVLADSPLVYLRLNEATPGTGTAADSSGNGRNGTYFGSPSSIAGLIASDSDTAVDFAGGPTQAVTSSYSPFISGSKRTFEIWGQRDTSTTNDTWFGSDTGTGNQTLCRSDASTGDLNFWADGAFGPVTWSGVITNGVTYHVVITYDDGKREAELFLNGVSKGVKAITNPYSRNGTYTLAVYGAGNDPFDGKLDEFAIYDGLLSISRVAAHYNAAVATAPSVHESLGSALSRRRTLFDPDLVPSPSGWF